MNSYSPCNQHANGHYETCKDCEIDALRDLLRQVANAPLGYTSASTDSDGVVTVHWQSVELPETLWNQLAPLRSGNKKEG